MGIHHSINSTTGPFAPEEAILGGIPTPDLDVPVTAVFLILFILGAATHLTLHELNGKRGHKFHLSDLVFDFCMVRVVSCTMRIVWSFRLDNFSIVLAALIFENAGVVVLFAVNIVLTQRILRAIHPNFGWHSVVSKVVFGLLASVPAIICWNIGALTAGFFTQDSKKASVYHSFVLFGACYTTFLSTIPIWVVGLAGAIPSPTKIERFGIRRFRYKVILLLFSAAILFAGALLRLLAGIYGHPTVSPGTIDSKSVFYATGFMLEIIVVISYAVFRFDLLFHIPDGCTGPGDYSRKESDEEEFSQDDGLKIMRLNSFDSQAGYSLATRDQLHQSVMQMKLQAFAIGHPIDAGDSQMILYAFKVKKGGPVQTPARAGSWYDPEYNIDT
jgi:hypothetical protein